MRRGIVTLTIFAIFAAIVVYPRLSSTSAEARFEPEPQQRRARRPQQRRRSRPQAARRPRVDYSKFNHRTREHRLACNACHTIPTPNWTRVRKEDERFPDTTDYPDHDACLRCHTQQFFSGAQPIICTVCHTPPPSPRNESRFAFQNPSEGAPGAIQKPKVDSQFTTKFPHDRHQDVMALHRPAHETFGGAMFVRSSFQGPKDPKDLNVDSCAICHQTIDPRGEKDSKDAIMAGKPEGLAKDAYWPEKGTFKTTPISHASCFNCHWKDGGEMPLATNCAGCHDLLAVGANPHMRKSEPDVDAELARKLEAAYPNSDLAEKWMKRESAKFKHDVSQHDKQGCTYCHINITRIGTLKDKTLDIPLLTCGGESTKCHISTAAKPSGLAYLTNEVRERRKDSSASFQCVRCHVILGKDPVPKSHDEAVPTPAAPKK